MPTDISVQVAPELTVREAIDTSQSPAVKAMLVKSPHCVDVGTLLVAVDDMNSPTFPAPAASFVVVPLIPVVVGLNVS
jgi:hypothetical protein